MGLRKLIKKGLRFTDASDIEELSRKLKQFESSLKTREVTVKEQGLSIAALELKAAIMERRIEFLESQQFFWTSDIDLSVNSDASKAFAQLILACLRASGLAELMLIPGGDQEANELRNELSKKLGIVNDTSSSVGVVYFDGFGQPEFEATFRTIVESGVLADGCFIRVPDFGATQFISREIQRAESSLVTIPIFRESNSSGNWIRLIKGG